MNENLPDGPLWKLGKGPPCIGGGPCCIGGLFGGIFGGPAMFGPIFGGMFGGIFGGGIFGRICGGGIFGCTFIGGPCTLGLGPCILKLGGGRPAGGILPPLAAMFCICIMPSIAACMTSGLAGGMFGATDPGGCGWGAGGSCC